jgi:hypothetical protein
MSTKAGEVHAADHTGPDVNRADLDRDLGRRQRLAREHRAEDHWTFGPATHRAQTSTLLLVGSASPPRAHQATEIARQALPNSRANLLDGHAHAAPRAEWRSSGVIPVASRVRRALATVGAIRSCTRCTRGHDPRRRPAR